MPVGILLAAGAGRRFDPTHRQTKLLFPYQGEALAAHAARSLLSVLERVVAVVPADAPKLGAYLEACGCEVLFLPARGPMSASLCAGVMHCGEAAGWVIALADMPEVQPTTIRKLAEAVRAGAGIAAPRYQGRRGNPVAFAATHRAALCELQGDRGARSLLDAHPVCELDVEDPGILFDIDTPDDVQTFTGQRFQ